MNTVGQIIKEARLKNGVSIEKLENITKIKSDFIIKIENNDWDNLPEFAVVSGFIKNIASSLDLSPDTLNAILRRDYTPKKININPKPDIDNKFIWSPKMSFFLGIFVLTLGVIIYLGFQYKKSITPPEISIYNPKENEVVLDNRVKVSGKTTTDVTLTINNQPVILDQDGGFNLFLDVSKETKNLNFKVVSRYGKMTEKNIDINVE